MTLGQDRIVVSGLRVWAHVGVLEVERESGQWFELDFELVWDLARPARTDDVSDSLNYATLIQRIFHHSRTVHCQTMEAWSDDLRDLVFSIYGPICLRLAIRKCAVPISGFSGVTGVVRHWPSP